MEKFSELRGTYRDCRKEQETRSDIGASWNEETSPHHTALTTFYIHVNNLIPISVPIYIISDLTSIFTVLSKMYMYSMHHHLKTGRDLMYTYIQDSYNVYYFDYIMFYINFTFWGMDHYNYA